jgi:hypothetical protein
MTPRHLSLTCITLLLAACGGDPGYGPADSPPAPPPPPEVTLLAGSTTDVGCVDGPATIARFGSTDGIAIDRDGSVLVADGVCHAVRRVAADGSVTTAVGRLNEAGDVQGSRNDARLITPGGLAIEPTSGQLFIADRGAHRVLSVAPDTGVGNSGSVTSIMGRGTAGDTTVGAPPGGGNDALGLPLRPRDDAALDRPTLLAAMMPGATELLMAEFGNQTLQTIATTTTSQRPVDVLDRVLCAGISRINGGPGHACSSNSVILVGDGTPGNRRVLAGVPGEVGHVDGIGDAARFTGPTAMVMDSPETLLVADQRSLRRVRLANGEVSTAVAQVGQFGRIGHIALAADGRTVFFTTARGVGRVVLP